MGASLGHAIAEYSGSIGLEQLDESVRQAQTSPTRSETGDAILTGGLGAE
jgi:hypothetical protein